MKPTSTDKVLVICVDRDNDVGKVTGFETPIIGRDRNLEAATKFAIRSPEDSDVNALFAAVGVYDELRMSGINCEIATISGGEEGGLSSDIKVKEELSKVLEKYQATEAIFVSDGASDELIIPIIQSRLPILSIRRVIIQQERGVEETYILISRYLRKIIEESQYARLFLGIPGIIFLLLAVLYISGYAQYTGIGALMVVGIAFIIRGFSIDTLIMNWVKSSPIIFFSSLMGFITILISIYMGVGKVTSQISLDPNIAGNLILLSGIFLYGIMDIMLIGVGIFIVGRLIDKILRRSEKIWHNIVGIVFIIFIRPLIMETSQMLIKQEYSIYNILTPLILLTAITLILTMFFTLFEEFNKRRKNK
ncbi:MAG: DUF373 family protein [Candidatus Methanomethylicia archaeon]